MGTPSWSDVFVRPVLLDYLKSSPKFPNVLAIWKAPHHDIHVSQVVFQLSSLIIPVILYLSLVLVILQFPALRSSL